MKTEDIPLWSDSRGIPSFLVRHVRPSGPARPAVLVIPGGGYHVLCENTEGTPIANRFDELGYQTFVLHYRCADDRQASPGLPYPPMAALQDAVRAMRLIRANADVWGVDPSAIAACGFSAGGHLAAALGTIVDAVDASNGDQFDAFSPVPDALLLCYPVILSDRFGHKGSRDNFFGRPTTTAEDELFSLDRHVTDATPPAFLWTTPEDTVVPMENSLAFLAAMRGHRRPCDLHVFARGPHGMQLGYGRHDIANWPQLASDFLRDTCGFRLPDAPCPGTVVLTFDDCPKNHLLHVAPILRDYGFGATFFVTRFSDGWRADHGRTLLSLDELKRLSDMGFEIGNHTWSHAGDLDALPDDEAAAEIDRLDDWLVSAGIPRPRVFAYPGGPYRAKAERLLRDRGYIAARAVENRLWNPAADSPFRLPSIPLSDGHDWDFYHAFAGPEYPAFDPESRNGKRETGNGKRETGNWKRLLPIFVFHGVPDRVHPWVNTEPATFAKFLAFLHGRGYRCVSLSAALSAD